MVRSRLRGTRANRVAPPTAFPCRPSRPKGTQQSFVRNVNNGDFVEPRHGDESAPLEDVRRRTRRVEIDLDNTGGHLLPGMYAVGIIDTERKGVWALPRSSVMLKGNQNVCYLYEDGKAVETPVQTGLANDESIEVLQKRVKGKWTAFTGAEQVILGELAQLRDREKVRVVEPEEASQESKP